MICSVGLKFGSLDHWFLDPSKLLYFLSPISRVVQLLSLAGLPCNPLASNTVLYINISRDEIVLALQLRYFARGSALPLRLTCFRNQLEWQVNRYLEDCPRMYLGCYLASTVCLLDRDLDIWKDTTLLRFDLLLSEPYLKPYLYSKVMYTQELEPRILLSCMFKSFPATSLKDKSSFWSTRSQNQILDRKSIDW